MIEIKRCTTQLTWQLLLKCLCLHRTYAEPIQYNAIQSHRRRCAGAVATRTSATETFYLVGETLRSISRLVGCCLETIVKLTVKYFVVSLLNLSYYFNLNL